VGLVGQRARMRGQVRSKVEKFFAGILTFVGLMLLLLGPMLVFSSANPTSQATQVNSVSTSLTVVCSSGSFELLSISSTLDIEPLSSESRQKLVESGVVASNDVGDGDQNVVLAPNSNSLWDISPSSLDFLISALQNNFSDSKLIFQYSFTKNGPSESKIADGCSQISLGKNSSLLAKLLNSSDLESTFMIYNLFPLYLQIPVSGAPVLVSSVMAPGLLLINSNLAYGDIISTRWFSLVNPSNYTQGLNFTTFSTPFVEVF
jgi:hypothetical protein